MLVPLSYTASNFWTSKVELSNLDSTICLVFFIRLPQDTWTNFSTESPLSILTPPGPVPLTSTSPKSKVLHSKHFTTRQHWIGMAYPHLSNLKITNSHLKLVLRNIYAPWWPMSRLNLTNSFSLVLCLSCYSFLRAPFQFFFFQDPIGNKFAFSARLYGLSRFSTCLCLYFLYSLCVCLYYCIMVDCLIKTNKQTNKLSSRR